MEIRLTEEQSAAVYAPVGENLVSAAAGSGKTKVLSERIVSRIKSGDTTIDRLLVVTFTRAAALQMREKIAGALEKEYAVTKEIRLKKQLSQIAGADICTIDSFCIDLVKKNFFRVDISPDFNIADSNEMRILRDEIILEVLDRMYGEGDESFMLLAQSVGTGKNDGALSEMIIDAFMFTRAFEEPDAWLDKAVLAHRAESGENNRLFELLGEEIEDRLRELGTMLQNAKNEAENLGILSYAAVLEAECMRFEEHLNCPIDKVGEGLDCFYFGTFSGKKEEGFADEKKHIQSLHNEAKELYKAIGELYDIYMGVRGVSYPKIEALVKCVKLFGQLYMEEKRSRKVLEFSDCEAMALKIIKDNEDVRDELRDKYDEIYIDEYQDTNPLQDALFTLISRKERGEPNLFIVGDVKQSIYRFRHSEPKLFAEKARTFGADGKSRKMILSRNFRSRREVLDSVNCVFEKIMRENTAQVDYNEEHRLKCGAKYIEYNNNKSELYILTGEYDTDEEEALLAVEQQETLVAAQRIKEMIESGFMVSDGDKMRPVRYSDIAVLSPKINGKADMVTNVFNLMGIPVFCEAAQKFFDAIEIKTVNSLLKAVDNPLCDIPLASVMRSPIFAFGENELVEIREDGRDKTFYENVEATAKKKTRLGRKCKSFVKTLSGWREASRLTSLEKFITRVIDESGYYSFVGALPGGGARQENLRRFIAVAAGYEKNQYKGLYNFVRYIDKTIEAGGEVENDIAKSENAVLVTSIHRSKGLEFPIVIVIGCGSGFNDKDSTKNLIMSPEGGMAIIEREKTRRVKFKTPEYRAIAAMIVRDNHAEQMRLLYVAMTRAKEKLILIGSVSSYGKRSAMWDFYSEGKAMSDYKIRSFKNYLDYICTSLSEEHWSVNVVDRLPEITKEEKAACEEQEAHQIVEEVIYRLSYLYPFDGIRNIPSKMSVSEIKKLSLDDEESYSFYPAVHSRRVPSFIKGEEKLVGNRRGTAFHRVMELIDLNEKDVASAIERFAQQGFMTSLEAKSVEAEKIEAFLKSPVAQRMRKARRIWREESFTVSIDARDVFPDGEEEKICVQGTIDCLFEDEDGRIVLLDYKTDIYTDPEEIAKRYKRQLELYEVAVFKRFGQKCDEKCLYLFHNDDIISV